MSRSYTYEEYVDAVQYFNYGTNDFFLVMHLPVNSFVGQFRDHYKSSVTFEVYQTELGYLYVDDTYKVYGLSERKASSVHKILVYAQDTYVFHDDNGNFLIEPFTNEQRNALYALYVK